MYCIIKNFPIAVYFKKEAWIAERCAEPYSSSDNWRNSQHHFSTTESFMHPTHAYRDPRNRFSAGKYLSSQIVLSSHFSPFGFKDFSDGICIAFSPPFKYSLAFCSEFMPFILEPRSVNGILPKALPAVLAILPCPILSCSYSLTFLSIPCSIAVLLRSTASICPSAFCFKRVHVRGEASCHTRNTLAGHLGCVASASWLLCLCPCCLRSSSTAARTCRVLPGTWSVWSYLLAGLRSPTLLPGRACKQWQHGHQRIHKRRRLQAGCGFDLACEGARDVVCCSGMLFVGVDWSLRQRSQLSKCGR